MIFVVIIVDFYQGLERIDIFNLLTFCTIKLNIFQIILLILKNFYLCDIN